MSFRLGNSLQHVALIPDGIRRWARSKGVSLDRAYNQVSTALSNISDAVYTHGAKSLSVYVLSKSNLQRNSAELDLTFASHIRIFREVLPYLVDKWQVRVFHTGDATCVPPEYMSALQEVCVDSCKRRNNREIYICAGYSVDWELNNGHGLAFTRHVPHQIDMLIRTGGEQRLSGFLPLQLQYAEFFFLQKFFPDVNGNDIDTAIQEFYKRDRRFGR